jgi:nitrite reductase (NADH) small subunit
MLPSNIDGLWRVRPMNTVVESAMTYIPICEIDDLPVGLGRAFEVGGHDIAVFRNREGRVFASSSHCPHRQGPLADGMISGDQIVCPFHAFKFDSKSGVCDQPDTCAIDIYPADVVERQVRIALPINQ